MMSVAYDFAHSPATEFMGSAAVGVALLMAGAFWIFAIVERLGFV